MWPLTGETIKPENAPQPHINQKQIQPQKTFVACRSTCSYGTTTTRYPIESQIPDEALDQVRHSPTPKDPVQEETEVSEPQWLPIAPPQPKPMVLERTTITSSFTYA